MSNIIKLTGVSLTGAPPKIIVKDPVESSGSLFLYDASYEVGKPVPANGATVANALEDLAVSNLGSWITPGEVLNATIRRTPDLANIWKVERTSKGGLYGLITQNGGQTKDEYLIMDLPKQVRDYIYNNRSTNTFYFSAWWYVVRPMLSDENWAPQSVMHYTGDGNATANYLFFMSMGAPSPFSGSTLKGKANYPGINEQQVSNLTRMRASIAVQGGVGTGPNSTNAIEYGMGAFSAWGSFNRNKAPSRILYRCYVEDLTLSGRTYNEVEAIDHREYERAFAPGGKFAQDEYPAPSTMA